MKAIHQQRNTAGHSGVFSKIVFDSVSERLFIQRFALGLPLEMKIEKHEGEGFKREAFQVASSPGRIHGGSSLHSSLSTHKGYNNSSRIPLHQVLYIRMDKRYPDLFFGPLIAACRDSPYTHNDPY